jgi:hypothetical protein
MDHELSAADMSDDTCHVNCIHDQQGIPVSPH